MAVPIHAQEKPKSAMKRAASYSVPYGYTQVGNTMIYYYQSYSSIDVQGYYNGLYYGSTYSNGGYRVAMKVNDGYAESVDCESGTTIDNVTCVASIEPQGELARICYTVTNANETDVTVSIGTHADVMIGDNDRAPIERRIDTAGNTYGVTMKDGNGAQLCVLFGAGLAGVKSVDDFWFGYYYLNSDYDEMVGNYNGGSNYMEENGSYDSGMGWCWKNRVIPAGATVVFSYLIGVGEVNLEPNSSFEVTPDDPEGWNDLSRPHVLALDGTYESPAGLDGLIEYAVESSEEWQPLTEMMASGSEFSASITAIFDPLRDKHVIRFRTRDNVGNTTMLPSIEYIDVSFHEYSGIENKTYTGEEIYQEVTCTDIPSLDITTGRYSNNVNVGTASFSIEGVFPHTIGRKPCTFRIEPALLTGDLRLATDFYVYDGLQHCPEWTFTNEAYAALQEGTDYSVTYANNTKPGTATVTVRGMGNYGSELTGLFYIDKAPLTDDLFAITVPDEDISYDGSEHVAQASTANGVGAVIFYYMLSGTTDVLAENPKEAGHYDIYVEIQDGELYFGRPFDYLSSFSIFKFDEAEWLALGTLKTELQQMGFTVVWDMAGGAKNVGQFEELIIREGHVVGVSLANNDLTGTFPTTLASFPELEEIDLSGNGLTGDVATIIADIKQQDAQAFSSLKMLDISHNSYSGNVGVLAGCFPSLLALNVSYNKFEDLYPALSASIVDLDFSHQDMDKVYDLDLANLSLDNMSHFVPTILLYNAATRTFNNSINMLCTAADLDSFDKYSADQWAMQLRIADNQVTMPYVSSQNVYYGESGDVLNVLNMIDNNNTDGSKFKIRLIFSAGDANFVNGIDATDLQATILYAFGSYTNYPFNFTAANTYKDEIINVQDVICTVNLLLAADDAQSMAARSRNTSDVAEAMAGADASIMLRDGKVVLNSRVPVASLSIKAKGNIKWNLESLGLLQSTSGSNVVAYSLNGVTLPILEDVVLGEYSDASICTASLSDADAQAIPASLNTSEAVAISKVSADEATEIYNAAGYRTNAISKGLNIIRSKGNTQITYNK